MICCVNIILDSSSDCKKTSYTLADGLTLATVKPGLTNDQDTKQRRGNIQWLFYRNFTQNEKNKKLSLASYDITSSRLIKVTHLNLLPHCNTCIYKSCSIDCLENHTPNISIISIYHSKRSLA